MVSFSKRIQRQKQNSKYNKDFLSIIFTDKKIKNPAKIRRPTQTNALGSKGRCPPGFCHNLHTSLRSGRILAKKP